MQMQTRMRIALLQFEAIPGDVAHNLATVTGAARQARAGGADLLIAPELALMGYGLGDGFAKAAEPADGPAITALAGVARAEAIGILCGFAERAGDAVYNSAAFVDGALPAQVYRKAFLYGPYEKAHFAAVKAESCLFAHRGLKVGVLICYDVEFPENVRRLARAGANLVAVPTALPETPHDAFISGHIVPVRAFENQVHVAYANLCGRDARFAYAGLSRVAAPDGTTLAEAGREAALIFADIRPGAFDEARHENPYLADLAEVSARG